MSTTGEKQLPLSPYRVLDLTDQKGMLGARFLADLGAEVIRVEKPGGDPDRKIGPFLHNLPHPERSLFWLFNNANKKSVTLDIETADGQAIFKKLVEKSDIVIESLPPGHLDKLGLGYASLTRINPRIIVTSISPFGQTGPYKDLKAPDLVAVSMSGMIYPNGDEDRPPVRISVPQAHAHTSLHAASATLFALYYREIAGEGQYIDVSVHESVVRTSLTPVPYWQHRGVIIRREGALRHRGVIKLRETWPCKDGYVAFRWSGGPVGASHQRHLVQWMDEEGMAGELKEAVKHWDDVDVFKLTQETVDRWDKLCMDFFMRHTKAELYEQATRRIFPLSPVSTVQDMAEDKQLLETGYFVPINHDELGESITYPGYVFRMSETPALIRRRAPLIGEHVDEVYQGLLGLSPQEIASLREAGVI